MHARDDLYSPIDYSISTDGQVDVDVHVNINVDGLVDEEDLIDQEDLEVLRVSAHSRPSAVAGAIAGVIRNQGRTDVQAIGAAATNQAIKALAIAREYLQPDGIDIVIIPAFVNVSIRNEKRTAIRMAVEMRNVPLDNIPPE